MFLNIRGKSVGEEVEVLVTCPDDGETKVPVVIALDDIEVQFDKSHSRDIRLDDTLVMRMSIHQWKNLFRTTSVFLM